MQREAGLVEYLVTLICKESRATQVAAAMVTVTAAVVGATLAKAIQDSANSL